MQFIIPGPFKQYLPVPAADAAVPASAKTDIAVAREITWRMMLSIRFRPPTQPQRYPYHFVPIRSDDCFEAGPLMTRSPRELGSVNLILALCIAGMERATVRRRVRG
jgi:hypothetical protein